MVLTFRTHNIPIGRDNFKEFKNNCQLVVTGEHLKVQLDYYALANYSNISLVHLPQWTYKNYKKQNNCRTVTYKRSLNCDILYTNILYNFNEYLKIVFNFYKSFRQPNSFLQSGEILPYKKKCINSGIRARKLNCQFQ